MARGGSNPSSSAIIIKYPRLLYKQALPTFVGSAFCFVQMFYNFVII